MSNKANFHIIIPARFASTRLPGKLLVDVRGKTLIQRVYEKAITCGAKTVTIATDDERIARAVSHLNANVCMTGKHHTNGTERLAETVQKLGLEDDAIIVNLQGDEPLIPIEAILKIVTAMEEDNQADVTTLCTPILDPIEIMNTNVVKVLRNKFGYALYFSRSPIPYNRDEQLPASNVYFRHLGLYAYRVKILKQYVNWEVSPAEELEKLEQLRILWHGGKIRVITVFDPLPPGVDTHMDLEKLREMI